MQVWFLSAGSSQLAAVSWQRSAEAGRHARRTLAAAVSGSQRQSAAVRMAHRPLSMPSFFAVSQSSVPSRHSVLPCLSFAQRVYLTSSYSRFSASNLSDRSLKIKSCWGACALTCQREADGLCEAADVEVPEGDRGRGGGRSDAAGHKQAQSGAHHCGLHSLSVPTARSKSWTRASRAFAPEWTKSRTCRS